MRIFHIPAYTDNYIWVMQSGSDISIIDPGDASPVLDHIKNNDLNSGEILPTHSRQISKPLSSFLVRFLVVFPV